MTIDALSTQYPELSEQAFHGGKVCFHGGKGCFHGGKGCFFEGEV
jgi:hypothetical protein